MPNGLSQQLKTLGLVHKIVRHAALGKYKNDRIIMYGHGPGHLCKFTNVLDLARQSHAGLKLAGHRTQGRQASILYRVLVPIC